jgi:hypothetical protein
MENKYAPFDEAEFNSIKQTMIEIGLYLPENKMGWMWEKCTAIRGQKENQPCGCKSASGLWKRCADDITDWVKKVDSNTNAE